MCYGTHASVICNPPITTALLSYICHIVTAVGTGPTMFYHTGELIGDKSVWTWNLQTCWQSHVPFSFTSRTEPRCHDGKVDSDRISDIIFT